MSDMINVSQCTNLTDRRMLHQYIIKELSVNAKARKIFGFIFEASIKLIEYFINRYIKSLAYKTFNLNE